MKSGLLEYCYPYQAPYEVEFGGFTDSVKAFAAGMPPEPRPELPGANSLLMCIIMLMILLVIFNIRQCPRFFTTIKEDLTRRRKRSNVFNERTVNETRIMGVFILQLCVCEALLLLPFMRKSGISIPGDMAPAVIGMLVGLTVTYYICQLFAYSLIGYVFAEKTDARLWLRGFNASQALLGWGLVLPALAVLFYPATIDYLLPLSGILYVIARILFFSKGFRIFYHGFSSLLYFILYLCSVEIVPLIIAYHAIFSLYHNLI